MHKFIFPNKNITNILQINYKNFKQKFNSQNSLFFKIPNPESNVFGQNSARIAPE